MSRATEEPLKVYPTRDAAEGDLPKYAHLCKSFSVTPTYRVKAAPMIRGRYKGYWGVWLVKHE